MNDSGQLIFDIDESEFLPDFQPYIDDQHAVQLFIGNSGSGKSVFLYKRSIAFALAKNYFRLVFTRKVKDTIRDSIFLGLKDVISDWQIKDHFRINEGQMDLHCRINGNMMMSFGMNDPEKLKSIKDPSHVLYDEFSDSDPGDFSELQRRLRTDKVKKTQFWGALNPVAAWWGREYFFADSESDTIPNGEVQAKTSDTLIFKATYHNNPHIDKAAYQAKNREMALLDENNWIVYELGDWGKAITGGEFYKAFRKRVHAEKLVDFIPGLPVHLTFDFNVLPYMTMLASQVKQYETNYDPESKTLHEIPIIGKTKWVTVFQVRIFREYCLEDPENTTEHCCLHFLEGYGEHKPDIFIYGDAMGNKRHEGTGNKTEFKKVKDQLARYLWDSSDRTWRANPSVLQRRVFMNKILAMFEIVPGVVIELLIDPSCKKTIEDFEKVILGVDGKLKEKFKDKKTGQQYEKYGHCTDAVDYLVTKMFVDWFKSVTV